MPVGRDNLKHVVVLMMENRSFDHMLGPEGPGLMINGLTGTESNPTRARSSRCSQTPRTKASSTTTRTTISQASISRSMAACRQAPVGWRRCRAS